MWDLCSPARDQTSAPCIGMESFNQQTTREVPNYCILYITHMQKASMTGIRWKYFQIPQQRVDLLAHEALFWPPLPPFYASVPHTPLFA